MASEILTSKLLADQTYYALIYNGAGQVYRPASQSFEEFTDANYSLYQISMTELGTSSGRYGGNLPSELPRTVAYTYEVILRVGASVALSDPVSFVGDVPTAASESEDEDEEEDDSVEIPSLDGMTTVAWLAAIRDRTRALMLQCQLKRRPTYNVDGQHVDHVGYMKYLQETLDWCDVYENKQTPWEITSEAY